MMPEDDSREELEDDSILPRPPPSLYTLLCKPDSCFRRNLLSPHFSRITVKTLVFLLPLLTPLAALRLRSLRQYTKGPNN
jgi:hypothetical protein